MQALFDFVMNHPFWALYLAILLGISIHGFRHTTIYYDKDDDQK